jgi:hypothetical protein
MPNLSYCQEGKESKSQYQIQNVGQGNRDLHVLDDTSHLVKGVFDSINNNPKFRISSESQDEISNLRHKVCTNIPLQEKQNEHLTTNKLFLEMDGLHNLLLDLLNDANSRKFSAEDDCESFQSFDSLEYYNRRERLSLQLGVKDSM